MNAKLCYKPTAIAFMATCLGLFGFAAQAVEYKADVSAATTLGSAKSVTPKLYNVGGALSLAGNVNAQISNPARNIAVSVGRIRNDSTTVTSGALRLRVFVTTVPLAANVSYYTIGESSLDPLLPLNSYDNYTTTMPLLSPPDGTYYLNLGIFEREESCGASDGFCPDDAGSFPIQVQVISGVFYNYTPPAEVPPADESTAIEYYHAGFDHYFVTAGTEEIAKLDSGQTVGWTRTGLTFGVWNEGGGERSPVCRFFSASFAPKSSHFYTPFSDECEIVKTNSDWTYEGIGGYIAMPREDGSCATGIPLYRLYNNGKGGAPNHRYTTSLVARANMIIAGWSPEGMGIGVIGCVPN